MGLNAEKRKKNLRLKMIMVADDGSDFFVQFPIFEKLKASNPTATIKGLVVYM